MKFRLPQAMFRTCHSIAACAFVVLQGLALPAGAFTLAADLSITKTNGVASVTPGVNVTYTITATNAGPDNALGSTVADTVPASLTGATWTCVGAGGGTCTASGSGNINNTVNLPNGGSVTYTVSATVSPTATGTVSNTATVAVGGGVIDPNPGNNSATDTDTVEGVANLAISVSDSPDSVPAGGTLTYSVVVSNSGPNEANGVVWSSTLPAGTAFVSFSTTWDWSCTTPGVGASGTVTCSKYSLASGSSASFVLVVAVGPDTATGAVLSNAVTVTADTFDPKLFNNRATATSVVAAATVDPTASIPLLSIPPTCGLVDGTSIVNLAAGAGPAFTASLVNLLSNAMGTPLTFVQQTACGSVVLSGYNGGKLAYIAYGFQTGETRANGVYPVGNGQYQVVAGRHSLVIAPTLLNLNQLIALLPGASVSQGNNGVITAVFDGQTYVVQAGVGVKLDTPTGEAKLVLGSDGYYHFIDAMGNNQTLYPAFKEPVALRGILLGMDGNATLNIQPDATATIVFNGVQYRLVPDLTLGPIPAERAGQSWWQEGAGRYRMVKLQGTQNSQGFTVQP